MARAKKATLQRLDPWLDEVRGLGIDGLVEKANGAFYRRRAGILHFHEDDDGVHADVKVGGEWVRVGIDGVRGKQRVIALLKKEYVATSGVGGGRRAGREAVGAARRRPAPP